MTFLALVEYAAVQHLLKPIPADLSNYTINVFERYRWTVFLVSPILKGDHVKAKDIETGEKATVAPESTAGTELATALDRIVFIIFFLLSLYNIFFNLPLSYETNFN